MLRFFDGFETYTTSACMDRRYSLAVSPPVPNSVGRLHGNSAMAASLSILRTRSLTLQNTWTYGFGYRYNSGSITTDTDSFPLIWLRGTSEQISLKWEKVSGENTFEWVIMRGATELGRTSSVGTAGKFTGLNWHYFEFQCTLDPVAGSFELRHNTQVILTDAGPINTADSGLAGGDVAEFAYRNNRHNVDDMYILDSTGTVNNSFLGDSVIEGRFPTGEDLAVHDWLIENAGVGSIDTYWEVCDAPTCVTSPTQYIFSATINDDAMMTFNALSFITGQVHAVKVSSDAFLDTSGTREFAHLVRSGGTTYQPGTTHSVAQTNSQSFEDILELDPDTGVKWTVAGVNAADFGMRLIS